MIARELLQTATGELTDAGCESPRLDAELLLMFCWKINRTALIMRSLETVPEAVTVAFQSLLARRVTREPIAYILGEKEFWSRSFTVSTDTLIPRPETEHLIESVLERFPDTEKAYQFCDIGTGSGCIAVTLACEYPHSHITATDLSEKAIEVAQINANKMDVSDRIQFRCGDMLAALNSDDGPFDAIISNPPYVASHEMDALEAELAHEPRSALTDEADGLQFLATIIKDGHKQLKEQAYIIVETGLCGLPNSEAGIHLIKEIHDLAGNLRGGLYQAGKKV